MKRFSFLLALLIAFGVSSCYKIISTTAPEEVMPGETFIVTLTVADDGDSNQKFINDWSIAGIRVPEGWTATTPAMSLQGHAEDWVYLEDGSKADKKYSMKAHDKVTAIYNEACPKNGYVWYGFQSRTKVPKFVSACWRNGCDSISVRFKVTVPADCQPGTYTLDMIAGDEEKDAGIDAYENAEAAKDSRVFHVGTFTHSYISHTSAKHRCTVKVVADPSGISTPNADANANAKTYTLDGKRVKDATKKGVYIRNGKKISVK